jgi:carboxyl-terminal processing protease
MRNLWMLAASICLVFSQSVHAENPDESVFQEFNEIVGEIERLSAARPTRQQIILGCSDGLFKSSSVKAPHLKSAIKPEATAEELLTIYQKVATDFATAPGQRMELSALVRASVNRYLGTLDEFSRYESPEIYGAYLAAAKGKASIGLTIQLKDGAMLCYPYPGLAADQAGVKTGDELLMVNGTSVKGGGLLNAASVIGGPAGTEVELTVQRTYGRPSRVMVKRETLEVPEVAVEKQMGGYQIKIRKFSKSAVEQLEAALKSASKARMLTLDLRGNGGGDLDAAAAMAELFLAPGKLMGSGKVGERKEDYISKKEPVIKPVSTTILQDEGTASAAEFFITALLTGLDGQVMNRGPDTFGKGVYQIGHVLRSGGFLVVTHGQLIGPDGSSWHKKGITQGWKPASPSPVKDEVK